VIETAHIIGAMTFIFSDQRFKSFPPDLQKILQEEGDRVMLEATAEMEQLEEKLKRDLIAKGMTFTPVNRDEWQAKLANLPKDFPELAPWVAKIQAVN
jgi:TRAP-type C4-dicarboxylate transport system substrate-binding protein